MKIAALTIVVGFAFGIFFGEMVSIAVNTVVIPIDFPA